MVNVDPKGMGKELQIVDLKKKRGRKGISARTQTVLSLFKLPIHPPSSKATFPARPVLQGATQRVGLTVCKHIETYLGFRVEVFKTQRKLWKLKIVKEKYQLPDFDGLGTF